MSAIVAGLLAVVPASAETGWRSVPAPGDGLSAVSAVGRWDAWAVGGSRLYRYSRSGWHVRRSIAGASLADVTLDSSGDGWAVGSQGTSAFALRRTSGGWHATATPQTASSAFAAVDARSPADAWAVGSAGTATLAEHWDGAAWSIVPTPPLPGPAVLRGVAIAGASDVWAVGDYTDPGAFDFGRIALIEHWDGAAWTRVPTHITPDYSDGYQDYFLHDIAVAGGRAWVVGDLQAYHIELPLVERWNGTRWSTVAVPHDSGSSGYCNAGRLATVSAVGAANVWAFGQCWDEFQHTYATEATALHLAGGVWSWVTLPAPQNAQGVAGSTAIPGTPRVWAVGAGREIDDVAGETISGPDSLALLGP